MMQYSSTDFIWWIGVVEDRMDPLMLGRVRVRIWGHHSNDVTVQPTEKLPWAIFMNNPLSASNSGIGSAPVGLLPGTWCVGWFIDGADMQQPIIMGTVGGIPRPENLQAPQRIDLSYQQTVDQPPVEEPEKEQTNVLTTTDGSPVNDSQGKPVIVQPESVFGDTVLSKLPPLTEEQIQKLKDAIGFKESSSVPGGVQYYNRENQIGFIGKYQFGAAALADRGYIRVSQGRSPRNSDMNDTDYWSGKNGIRSKEDFFGSAKVQEEVMMDNMVANYKIMTKRGVITPSSSDEKVAGLLAVAHLLGAGGAIKFANGTDGKDANGTSGTAYYELGAKAVRKNSTPQEAANAAANASVSTGTTPAQRPRPLTDRDPREALNSPSNTVPRSFTDPARKYPKREYINRPDVNRLATGQPDETLLQEKENNLTNGIPTANGGSPWDEPIPAWAATYPYNKVFESEAGHVIEIDDTPGQERVHIWHTQGSYIEIDVNGTSVRKVVGDNYELFERNNNLYVRGAFNVTADGVTKILVRDNADIEVNGKTNLTVHDDLDVNVAGDFNVVAGGDIKMRAGGSYHMRAGGMLAWDSGSRTRAEMGASQVPGYGATNSIGGGGKSFEPFKRDGYSGTSFVLDAGEDGAEEIHRQQVESGEVVERAAKESDTDTKPPEDIPLVAASCEDFNQFKTFPPGTVLSRYFTLGQLSSQQPLLKTELVEQRGLSKAEIACNLKQLAVNCLDKIKEKYPDMFVTNAFRKPYGSSSGKSDHETGCAADLQFRNAKPGDYFEIAKWIRDNVPYKQLLLEYGGGANNPWIHISLDGGNKHPLRVATFRDHKVYARDKLVNLA